MFHVERFAGPAPRFSVHGSEHTLVTLRTVSKLAVCCAQWHTRGMSVRQLGHGLAMLAIIGTLAILLFPAASGPYSVTHGPVTAFRAVRIVLMLMLSVVLSATAPLRITRHRFRLSFLLARSADAPAHEPVNHSSPLLQASSILRC